MTPQCGNCGSYMTQIDATEWWCGECDNYYDPTMPMPPEADMEIEEYDPNDMESHSYIDSYDDLGFPIWRPKSNREDV